MRSRELKRFNKFLQEIREKLSDPQYAQSLRQRKHARQQIVSRLRLDPGLFGQPPEREDRDRHLSPRGSVFVEQLPARAHKRLTMPKPNAKPRYLGLKKSRPT